MVKSLMLRVVCHIDLCCFASGLVILVSICVGVSRLMDLLADSREVIRNDVSLHALSVSEETPLVYSHKRDTMRSKLGKALVYVLKIFLFITTVDLK